MISNPNCKINLGLHITEKRPDGYHNIETVFYPIALCDRLEISPSERFSFSQNGIRLECMDSDNLCVKAYKLIKNDFSQIGNVDIKLTKNIPFGAGLGGGSADAAFTLMMLNSIFALQLSDEQLADYARKLGADCAFFVRNTPVYATEKGDVFAECSISLSNYSLLLVKPDIFISTPEAYSGVKPHKAQYDIRNILSQPIETWKNKLVNDFEESIFPKHPLLSDIKSMLYDSGAVYAAMSGSGSSMYGIFPKNAKISMDILDKKGFTHFIADL
jgi:4-diphosphocytidyl-2-C-methyl-D-erythritol kinase